MKELIQELEELRVSLIEEIDAKIALMQQKVRVAAEKAASPDTEPEKLEGYESLHSFSMPSAFFKGKRPTGIVFADQTRIDVPTWKKVFQEILKRCNEDLDCHQALMNLRGKMQGRSRVLLSNKDEGMRSPVKIDRALYAEAHYDTETLLKILKIRILDEIKYDYSDIKIAVHND